MTPEQEAEWRQEKSYGAIRVGMDRCYWVAVRFGVYLDMCHAADWKPDRDPSWLIGEGFEPTLEAAQAKAHAVAARSARRVVSLWASWSWSRSVGARLVSAVSRPKPSEATGARPEGMLGYLWMRSHVYSDWSPTPTELAAMGKTWAEYEEEEWLGKWKPCPITKITTKRIWIADPDNSGSDLRQFSFDRAKLERDGRADGKHWVTDFYTEADKEAEFAERRKRGEETIRAMFPMLGLSTSPTRRQVMAAFRKRARELHPDAGGDTARFRDLVAEKDRALGMVA